MKILQVAQRFPPSVGGMQYHVYEISKELVKMGHDVTVVTTTSMHNRDIIGFSTGRPFALKSTCLILPKFEVVDGIKVYRFKPIFQFWIYMVNPSMITFIIKNIYKYNVIHAHFYTSAEADISAFTSKLKNVPLILTGHDIETTYGGFYKFMKKGYDKTAGRFTLNTAKKLIALTEENNRQYEALGVPENKIVVIPNGVDYEKFDNLIKSKELLKSVGNQDKVILFVGRLLKYKGAQHIIKAIPEIINDYPNTKFIFVGEDQGYKKELIKLATDLDVFDECVFTGRVNEKELLRYYSIADAFILPSTGEGFGLVALEAIVSGTPVILASTGGLKHILSEIGGYPLDMTSDVPEQIAENVKKVFFDPDVKKEIEREKEVIKRDYTWKRVAEMTEKVYEGLV